MSSKYVFLMGVFLLGRFCPSLAIHDCRVRSEYPVIFAASSDDSSFLVLFRLKLAIICFLYCHIVRLAVLDVVESGLMSY